MATIDELIIANAPLAYYRTAVGTNVPDESGNGHDATLQGATHVIDGPYGGKAFSDFFLNTSDGDLSSLVRIPTSVSIDLSQSVTIEMFYRLPTGAANNSAFAMGESGTGDARCQAHMMYGGTLYWDYGHYSDGRLSVSYPGGDYDQWTHVCLVVNASTNEMAIWLDGVKVASGGWTPQTGTRTGGYIGCWPQSGLPATPADIAEFAVYDHVLSDAVILAHSTPSIPEPPPPDFAPNALGDLGLYYGHRYYGGDWIIPMPPPRPPYERPKQVRVVRELPPTRQVISVETPRGYVYRWASDERVGENVPSGIRNSSTAPGGYEQFDAVLPRNPNITYNDLEPMSTIRAEGIDGSEIGEYRLEATPDTSGDQFSISPSAVGWQNAMNDSDAQSLLIIDRDLSHWSAQDLQQRQEDLRNEDPDTHLVSSGTRTGWPLNTGKSYVVSGGFDPNPGGAGNSNSLTVTIGQPPQVDPSTVANPWNLYESMYDAGSGAVIGEIRFGYMANFGAGWVFNVLLWNTNWQFQDLGSDSWAGMYSGTTGLTGSGDKTLSAPDTNRGWRRAIVQMYYPGALTGDDNTKVDAGLIDIRVIGAHGLTLRNPSHADFVIAQANGFTGSEAEYQRMTQGFLASDIVKYIIQNFVPMLSCDDSTIQPSSFIIPQANYQNMKPGDMVNDAIKYGEPQPDWFVWGKRKFYLHDRGARGNHWRARAGSAKLTETGADVSKLYNKIWVKYTDVSQVEITVGPPAQSGDWCVPDKTYGPGGDVDTLSTRLIDNEPDNPINQLRDRNGNRMIKQGVLVLSSPVGNPDDAAKIGHDFLVQSKQISRAGQATFTGFVENARTGMLSPYHAVKAGDDVEFVDAADTSARRIQHVDHDDGSRVATVALDAPPDTLQGMLERIGATIIPLGL